MTIVQNFGDIFTSTQPAHVHGVNVYGVMGAGIAVLYKRKYPEIFSPYVKACEDGSLQPGGILPIQCHDGVWVVNAASQDKPGRYARLEWLDSSLRSTAAFMRENNISGLALPRIGAGIGGLDWDDCLKIIEDIDADYPELMFEIWNFDK